MNSDCCDSFFVGKLTSRALTPCKNITKMIAKRLAKMRLKIRQKLAFIWGHAVAYDTAVRVPERLTTASPWHVLSHALVLDFVGVYLDPS